MTPEFVNAVEFVIKENDYSVPGEVILEKTTGTLAPAAPSQLPVSAGVYSMKFHYSNEHVAERYVGNNPHTWLFSKINEFASLRNNWDGYNGIPVLPEIAEHARNLVRMLDDSVLEKVSDIFPSSNGTLCIEWENEKEEKLFLEIGQHNYSYFVRYNNADPKLVDGENILSNSKELAKEVIQLFSKVG